MRQHFYKQILKLRLLRSEKLKFALFVIAIFTLSVFLFGIEIYFKKEIGIRLLFNTQFVTSSFYFLFGYYFFCLWAFWYINELSKRFSRKINIYIGIVVSVVLLIYSILASYAIGNLINDFLKDQKYLNEQGSKVVVKGINNIILIKYSLWFLISLIIATIISYGVQMRKHKFKTVQNEMMNLGNF
jgi:amino acid transporter